MPTATQGLILAASLSSSFCCLFFCSSNFTRTLNLTVTPFSTRIGPSYNSVYAWDIFKAKTLFKAKDEKNHPYPLLWLWILLGAVRLSLVIFKTSWVWLVEWSDYHKDWCFENFPLSNTLSLSTSFPQLFRQKELGRYFCWFRVGECHQNISKSILSSSCLSVCSDFFIPLLHDLIIPLQGQFQPWLHLIHITSTASELCLILTC